MLNVIKRLVLKKNKEMDHGVCRGDNYNAWISLLGNLKGKRLLDRRWVNNYKNIC